MTLSDKLDLAKTIAAWATPIVTSIGFFFVYSQLKVAQDTYQATTAKQKNDLDWKRAEYIDGKIQKQFSDQNIKTVLQMLDYADRSYVLDRVGDNSAPLLIRVFHFEWQLHEAQSSPSVRMISLQEALNSDNQGHTGKKIKIREMFDELFSHIESLERLLEADLLVPHQLAPYYKYYIDRIVGDKNLRSIVESYVDMYGFQKAQNFLFNRFSSPASDRRTA